MIAALRLASIGQLPFWQGPPTHRATGIIAWVSIQTNVPFGARPERNGFLIRLARAELAEKYRQPRNVGDAHERGYVSGVRYSAFVDVSGGGADSFALGIAHKQNETTIIARKAAPLTVTRANFIRQNVKVTQGY